MYINCLRWSYYVQAFNPDRLRRRRPAPVPRISKPVKRRRTDGYVTKRFFIAVLHGGDWTKDQNTLADGPFYFGQAMKKITGQEVADLLARKEDGDLWVKFWKLSSSDVKIDSSDPYSAVERYLTDAWVPGSNDLVAFESAGVCLWLDGKETGHMTMDKDGSSIVFSAATKALVRSEIKKNKVCNVTSINVR
jgi:hypothetical protein